MTYTVFGVYQDPLGQRYATTVAAASPEDPERAALDAASTDGLDGVPTC